MDRPSQQLENTEKADGDLRSTLLDDIRDHDTKAKPLNIEKESQKIADLFDLGKNPDYNKNIVEGSERLSSDLHQLLGNREKYNKLLESVADRIPDEPAANPGLDLKNWNVKTGTWDKASVVAGDGIDAYRIVQPGNTLSQIALDTYRDFVKAAGGPTGFSYSDYMKSVVELNKIADPDKIFVGQAIRLRSSFAWG